MKTCTQCATEKPLDAFGPRKTARDGRYSYCRECGARAANERNWTKRGIDPAEFPRLHRENNHRSHMRQLSATLGGKWCSTCQRARTVADFSVSAKQADRLHTKCRDCDNETGRAWNAANAERHRENSRAWRETNAERKAEAARAWRETPAGRASKRESARRRRAAKALLPDDGYTDADMVLRMEELDDWTCSLTGIGFQPGDEVDVEHAIALQDDRGDRPGDVFANVGYALKAFNISKSNRFTTWEYREFIGAPEMWETSNEEPA